MQHLQRIGKGGTRTTATVQRTTTATAVEVKRDRTAMQLYSYHLQTLKASVTVVAEEDTRALSAE